MFMENLNFFQSSKRFLLVGRNDARMCKFFLRQDISFHLYITKVFQNLCLSFTEIVFPLTYYVSQNSTFGMIIGSQWMWTVLLRFYISLESVLVCSYTQLYTFLGMGRKN